jgi:hypothetical protein
MMTIRCHFPHRRSALRAHLRFRSYKDSDCVQSALQAMARAGSWRNENGELEFRYCAHCKARFWAKQPHAKFCSTKCRKAAYYRKDEPPALQRCECCGSRFRASMPHARFCSPNCRVAAHRAARAASRG